MYKKNQQKGYVLMVLVTILLSSIAFNVIAIGYFIYLRKVQIKIIHDVNTFKKGINKRFNI